MIEEVILNLINNAAEAMKDTKGDKNIGVASSIEKNRIVIKVSDSGPGVPLNFANKIFDPFYSTKDGSSGIGLSLSHRIVKDHGGSLDLAQSKWGGAEFIIEIPIKKGDA
jgi:signal transduction histidine kinase